MSTVNVRPSTHAAGSVAYVLYGRGSLRRDELLANGQTRAASYALRMANGGSTPAEFVKRAERLAKAHSRKNELYSYVLAFHPDEFDVTNQRDLDRVRDVAVEMAERMHTADYLIAVHADSAGGHAHAHVLVINHDNLTNKSLQRYTSWKHGLRQLNDKLMSDEGLRVLPNPAEPKPHWELRREAFVPGGFEQTLGDLIYLSLNDSRSIDHESFEQVLEENGVRLKVTGRDGWTYSMRREDNGKWGRKKASVLTPDFTAEGAQKIFVFRTQKGSSHGTTRKHTATRRATKVDYGDVGELDLSRRRRRTTDRQTDEGSKRPEVGREDDGRGSHKEAGGVDLAAARAALEAATRRRDEEKYLRDQQDARRRRIAAEQQRSREAARRQLDHSSRRGRLQDDEVNQAGHDEGDYEIE